MSLLSKLFGSKPKQDEAPKGEEYKGFRIYAEPMREGSVYRLSARIELDVDGGMKEHHVIRADTFGDKGEAAEISVSKAKQLIDQLGERLFN